MEQRTRILIVDDSTSFRKGMRALLEIQPDLQVVGEAQSGEEAMELAEKLQPDLILLDAKMPGMTGIEFTQKIKPLLSQVKILLITMYPDYSSEAIKAGVDAVLSKGIPPKQILAAIRKAQNRDG